MLTFDILPKSFRKHGTYFAHLYIRTLFPNIDQVKLLLIGNDFDVLALNETRLCDSVNDIHVSVDKYAIYRKDRNRQGGGVLIYINENRFQHTIRSDLMSENIELVAVEINQTRSAPIIILAWYRPPGSCIQLFEYIEQTLSKLDNENKDIILLGDFNCDLLANPRSCYTKKLLEVCNRYSLDQVIDKPTRVVQNSQTLIDLIFTSNSSKVIKCGVHHIAISDHSLVYIIWGKSRSTLTHHVYKKFRHFKDFNESDFQADVSKFEWNRIYNTSDLNESANEFQNLLLPTCDKNAPVKKKKVKKNNLPWINADILKLIRERDSIKNKAVKTNSDDDWKTYKKIKNFATAKLKYEKKENFPV